MRAAREVVWALVLGLGLGCGTGDGPGWLADAATLVLDARLPPAMGVTRDYRPDAPRPPAAPRAPPAPPAAPRLTPCPVGWIEEASDPPRCHALPANVEPARCAVDEALFPGRGGCVRLGPACPAATFAGAAPSPNVLYVTHDAPGGGDGSRATPMTLEEALAEATAGTTVWLGRGRYAVAGLALPAGIVLAGACVADTVLVADPADGPLLHIQGGEVTVRDLGLEGGSEGVHIEGAGTTATLRNVALRDVGGTAVTVDQSAEATLARVLVHTIPLAGVEGGDGLRCTNGSSCTVREMSVVNPGRIGILSEAGARIDANDVTVFQRDLRERVDDFGMCVDVEGGGTLTLRRAHLERCRFAAVYAYDASLELTDLSIAHVGVSDPRPGIRAGVATFRSSLRVSRAWIRDASFVGLATLEGGTAFVTDLLVEDVAPGGVPAHLGAGVYIDTASGTFKRVHVARTHAAALFAYGEGTSVSGDDLTLAHTRVSEFGTGHGLQANEGPTIDLARVHIDDSENAGLSVFRDATVTAKDLLVTRTRPSPGVDTSVDCVGLFVSSGRLSVERARVEESVGLGAMVQSGAEARLQDTVIRETILDPRTGRGRGISTAEGGHLELERVEIEGSDELGLLVGHSTATVEDVLIHNTRRVLPEAPGPEVRGTGLLLVGDPGAPAELVGGRVAVREATLVGAFFYGPEATVELTDLRVSATRPIPGDLFGRGLQVGGGADVRLERAVVADSREIGIAAVDEDTRLLLSNAAVMRTEATGEDLGGIGMIAVLGADAEASGFVVQGSALAGIQIALEGTGSFDRGLVFQNLVGLNDQTGARLDAVVHDVRFFDNGVDLDASALYVPDTGLTP